MLTNENILLSKIKRVFAYLGHHLAIKFDVNGQVTFMMYTRQQKTNTIVLMKNPCRIKVPIVNVNIHC